jgi:N-acetylmuramoyl-L-alanine amidase
MLALAAGLLTGFFLSATAAASAATAPVRLQGRDYVRLDDWARQHQFKVTRTPNSREVLAVRAGDRLTLTTDGRRIEFNGVGLWLSHTVLLTNQQVMIAQLDARGVLTTLANPPQRPPGQRIRTICIDPGHGGKEPGHLSSNRLEKTYTLLLAQEVRRMLQDAGLKVVLTRHSDTTVELMERTAIARKADADLFVSLHYNAAAASSTTATGIEVYAMTPVGARSTNASNDAGPLGAFSGNRFDTDNLLLAYQVQRALTRSLPKAADRGVRRARFMVLRLAEMPAILIEAGFMSHQTDGRWIYSQNGRRQTARAIADGILAYQRTVERGTSSTSSSKSTTPSSARK